MQFFVNSHLHYQISSPATILCSLSCVRTPGQLVYDESLTTSRQVIRTDLSVGQEENRFTKLEISEPGELTVQYQATASTQVSLRAISDVDIEDSPTLHASVIPYLFPSRYAPADRMRAAANDLFGHINGQLNQALAVEDWLYSHLSYQIGVSNEQTWALDTLEHRAGDCRDFAHLGISFCRALTIPARYVTVYAFQLQPQDFHAVFEVFVNGTWYLIDGTRIAPLNGMIRIAMGRDASDAAVATLFGGIEGQGISVQTMLSADENDVFTPITREDLRSWGKVLALG